MKNLIFISLVAFLSWGCQTAPALGPNSEVPMSQKTQCQQACASIGMKLSSMVIIRNSSGCVCSEGQGKSAAAASAAASGAILAIMDEEEAARNQGQNRQTTINR